MKDITIPWNYDIDGLLFPTFLAEKIRTTALSNMGREIFGVIIGMKMEDYSPPALQQINRDTGFDIPLSSVEKLKKRGHHANWALVTRVSDLGPASEIGVKSSLDAWGSVEEHKKGKEAASIEITDSRKFYHLLNKIEEYLEARGHKEGLVALYHTHPYDNTSGFGRKGIKSIQGEVTELGREDKEFFFSKSNSRLFSTTYDFGLFFGAFGYYYEGSFLNYKMNADRLGAEVSRYAKIEKGQVKVSALRLFRKAPGNKVEEVKMLMF